MKCDNLFFLFFVWEKAQFSLVRLSLEKLHSRSITIKPPFSLCLSLSHSLLRDIVRLHATRTIANKTSLICARKRIKKKKQKNRRRCAFLSDCSAKCAQAIRTEITLVSRRKFYVDREIASRLPERVICRLPNRSIRRGLCCLRPTICRFSASRDRLIATTLIRLWILSCLFFFFTRAYRIVYTICIQCINEQNHDSGFISNGEHICTYDILCDLY